MTPISPLRRGHRPARGVLTLALAAATTAGAFPAEAAARHERPLRLGSRGHHVRVLQRWLTLVGQPTAVDGIFGRGTRRSVRLYERAEQLRVDGRVSRMEFRGLRRRARAARSDASPAPESGRAQLSPDGRTAIAPQDAPQAVQDAINAANEITDTPYRYGGGHRSFRSSGYDCSGSVSYALHGGGLLDRPLDSTGFMRWARHGRGTWITVYANHGHAYTVIAGLRFDTSGRGENGPRWRPAHRSRRGFVARHPEGL